LLLGVVAVVMTRVAEEVVVAIKPLQASLLLLVQHTQLLLVLAEMVGQAEMEQLAVLLSLVASLQMVVAMAELG
jgi:hypothetical protein